MAYKSRKERKARASGGKAEHWMNAQGSPEQHEAEEKDDGFKRGGRTKRRHGGHVDGEKGKHHLGKRARGGAMEKREEKREEEEKRARGGHVTGRGMHKGRARGGAPFSAAHHTSPPSNKEGSPGEQAPLV